jgi:hypothetical protein
MESNKHIVPSGYLIALMLFALPLFDGMVMMWPFRLGEERWRFGALGSLGNMTLMPLLGILLALWIAIAMDQRRVRRIIGGLCAAFALFFAVGIIIFLLDFFQMRTMIKPQFKGATDVAAMSSLFKQALTAVALVLLAKTGLSGPKKFVKKEILPPEASTTPLIRTGSVQVG